MQILGVANSYASAPVDAPTSLSATVTTTTATVSFTAPTNDGGSAITNYEYSFNNSTWTALSPADALTPITISGLTANTAYTIYLRAVNIVGSGPASTGLAKTTASNPIDIEYLVIAGGGSGGSGDGGGGGAGGYKSSIAGESNGGGQALSAVLSRSAGTYTVTVGGASNSSVFDTITSTAGSNGAGGNGAGGSAGSFGYGGGNGTAGQGNSSSGGGGGGAGGAGSAAYIVSGYINYAGNGGAGISSSANGTSTARGGGGGGSGGNRGSASAGGGVGSQDGGYGNSGGAANTGGGAGGAGFNGFGQDSVKSGGSGLVIVRYLTSAQGAWTVTGGSITTSGSYRIHTFTGSGSLVIS